MKTKSDLDGQSDRTEEFLLLYNRHHNMLYGYIANLIYNINDVDDILQNTLKTLWQKFDQYDPSRKFSTWACKFAFNEVRNYRQKLSTQNKYFSDQLVESMANIQMERLEKDEKKDGLAHCLSQLESKDRELIEQRYSFHGSMQELAAKQNVSPNSLYKTLQRIRQKILFCIKSYDGGVNV